MRFREHADGLSCEFQEAEVLRVEENGDGYLVTTSRGELKTKTIVAAMGAEHAKLNIPGEEELAGMGVSYCATCDGAFFRNRTVAVVGGGDVAVEDAIFLARNCAKVYLVHRRDELRAAKSLQEALQALPNVEILWDTVATEIKGEDQVEALALKNVKTEETQELPVDGVFILRDAIAPSQLVPGLATEENHVKVNLQMETNLPGLFACGDIAGKPYQYIKAAGQGNVAALSAVEYLDKKKREI